MTKKYNNIKYQHTIEKKMYCKKGLISLKQFICNIYFNIFFAKIMKNG